MNQQTTTVTITPDLSGFDTPRSRCTCSTCIAHDARVAAGGENGAAINVTPIIDAVTRITAGFTRLKESLAGGMAPILAALEENASRLNEEERRRREVLTAGIAARFYVRAAMGGTWSSEEALDLMVWAIMQDAWSEEPLTEAERGEVAASAIRGWVTHRAAA